MEREQKVIVLETIGYCNLLFHDKKLLNSVPDVRNSYILLFSVNFTNFSRKFLTSNVNIHLLALVSNRFEKYSLKISAKKGQQFWNYQQLLYLAQFHYFSKKKINFKFQFLIKKKLRELNEDVLQWPVVRIILYFS